MPTTEATPAPPHVPTAAPTATSAPAAATATAAAGGAARPTRSPSSDYFIDAQSDRRRPPGQSPFNITNTSASPRTILSILSSGQQVTKSRSCWAKVSLRRSLRSDLACGHLPDVICDVVGHKEAGMVGTLTVK